MITPEKRREILDRLKEVDTSEMCRRAGVKRRTFYAVLDNESSHYEVVEAVLQQADIELNSRLEKVNSL
ncbi:hypothetical protein FHW36_10648 [Chitinophaga polysaccharea]|uniref:Uncharacterized protein n=1 Tax=Chitinophaga polysaccharea TaxID=1293035 RepID=A0A561PL38_9BACT|nr:hypothetical protein [Chitinophaga polysaccharea]TWF38827.1 hypothetical protein FHW36_10648 [Chitinophaga polysaccharea]